ncbi:hypothetical protein VHARVF571_550033 [Vibrio harveyi]|nr:hypothetical protein VHARVF571_550033 [Vibrio harveyi]
MVIYNHSKQYSFSIFTCEVAPNGKSLISLIPTISLQGMHSATGVPHLKMRDQHDLRRVQTN